MNPARREPLLWLQLLGLAALPLEALLLLLVLAGADPGPFPGFERVLAWALGALAPAALFWRLPPDLWSLLLVQVPLRGRRPEQLRLSALQAALPLKLLAAAGAAMLLPLLWWSDASAGLAWAWSPLSASPRLVVLLVSVPLLALMLWQWQQLIQAVWMFTRPATLVEQTLPLTQAVASETRLNAGLPLLLLPPLVTEAPAEPPATPQPAPFAATEPVQVPEPAITEPETDTIEEPPAPEAEESDVAQAQAEPAQRDVEQPEPDAPHGAPTASEAAVIDAGVAITPEQSTEEDQSTHLDS